MICVFSGSPLSQKNSNHDINENERHRTTFASSFLPSIISSHKKNQLLRKILTFENAPVKSEPSHWQLLPLHHPPNRSESDEVSSCTIGGWGPKPQSQTFPSQGYEEWKYTFPSPQGISQNFFPCTVFLIKLPVNTSPTECQNAPHPLLPAVRILEPFWQE